MALAVMYDLPDLTRPRYDDAMRALNFDRRRPKELWVHAAWEKEEGGWQIFEVWESQVPYKAFLQERFTQVLRERSQQFSVTILSNNVHHVYANE